MLDIRNTVGQSKHLCHAIHPVLGHTFVGTPRTGPHLQEGISPLLLALTKLVFSEADDMVNGGVD